VPVKDGDDLRRRTGRSPRRSARGPPSRCPVRYLRGDQEPADLYPAEDFKAAAAGECAVGIIARCGHFYVEREDEVSATVATWLARTLRPADAAPG
jgi:hypothetical protein